MPDPILTPLAYRGHAVLPTPQKVTLFDEDIRIEKGWHLHLGNMITEDDPATKLLKRRLVEDTGLMPVPRSQAALRIELAVTDRVVAADQSPELRAQGYLLEITKDKVKIVGNGKAGLFYGVQTLLQLFTFRPEKGWILPACRIEDWPELELRCIHYDTKHHQETLEGVKLIIDRAVQYKINAIIWEIEDKFAYRKHPLIAAPGAFTADEVRKLTAYALERHIQIVPLLQMPSHNAFIAKHKKYKHLLEDPNNNYMLCPSNPGTIKLYKDLITELIEATPGCRYFHLGTDEPYFLGQGKNCACKEKVKQMGQGGLFAELINTMNEFLKSKGRIAMYWGEHPMGPEHVKLLPPGTINAVMLEPERSREYRKRGIRELVYTPTQGARLLFPDYWPCRSGSGVEEGRLAAMTRKIREDAHRENNVLGTLVAAWDDSGLNNETFWLGWAVGSAAGWNPWGAGYGEAVSSFMLAFYGPNVHGMEEAYLLLHELTDFWISSWERIPSRRGPSYMRRYHPRRDLILALPHIPDPVTLNNRPFWRQHYGELLKKADEYLVVCERLSGLLYANMLRASRNKHNLEVLLSLARLMEHQVLFLRTLARVEDELSEARKDWDVVRPGDALQHLHNAVQMVRRLERDREERYQQLVTVWERTRKPKGAPVGRKVFVHIQDDTKNHTADHAPDLSYLIEAYRNLNLEQWTQELEKVATAFQKKYGAIEPEPDYMMD
ncbi:MAG: glycoside hydrolase family 20 zincin-like fold domain-containing protein [Kiritimatiellia bacterium]